ncbi:uncharacterized protein LOC120073425 [Benincasa hispida]|uniref:uncharacterized protein LOC120073425 n=1 Tax=Benincasa hispida TaxID=102211 RepID=UPI0019006533|nr:uncharacterized protein LOC120073425 [Benincasa hispida]
MVRNGLLSVYDSDGIRQTSHSKIANVAVEYFSGTLGSQRVGYRDLTSQIDAIVQGKLRCVMKVDLQKAYDSVNWAFLFVVLLAIRTPLKFVSWIRACVTSPFFSMMINGALKGYFSGRKGLRQGDPMSPFLFVVVMEVLSRLLNNPPPSFVFHHRCEKFAGFSGLVANVGKSSMFVADVSGDVVKDLTRSMGFALGSLPEVDRILRAYLWHGRADGNGGVFGMRFVCLNLKGVWDVVPRVGEEDSWAWIPSTNDRFTVASLWESLYPRHPRVAWACLVWSEDNIPRHSFCARLAVKDRLGTWDWLRSWDQSVDNACLLCLGEVEFKNHLFFDYVFGREIWEGLVRFLDSSHRVVGWDVELSWGRNRRLYDDQSRLTPTVF